MYWPNWYMLLQESSPCWKRRLSVPVRVYVLCTKWPYIIVYVEKFFYQLHSSWCNFLISVQFLLKIPFLDNWNFT